MTVSIKRQVYLRDQAREKLRTIFSDAAHFGTRHDEMLARRNTVFATVAKCPQHVRMYLQGYWDCLQTQAYKTDLVYGGLVNGKFYSVHNNRADYYGKHDISPADWADGGIVLDRGHYWVNTHKLDPQPF